MEEDIERLIKESTINAKIDEKQAVKISSNEQIMMSKAYALFSVDESGKLQFSMDTKDLNDMEVIGFYASVKAISQEMGNDEYEDEVQDE